MGLDNPLHIAFLVVILLLLFGARRLPEIGRSLGTGMREFKDSISGSSSSSHEHQALPQQAMQAPPVPQAPPPPVQQPPVQQQPPAQQPPVQPVPPAQQAVAPAPAPENIPQG